MNGYALVHGFCCSCNSPLAFNPHKVPSIRIKGERQPVCRACIEKANVIRAQKGMSILTIAPDAYEPIPEEDL